MAGTIAGTIRVAEQQLGTRESPMGSNHQPYGVWYGMDRVAWCAIFASYVLWHSGRALPIRTAKGFSYCPDIVAWAHSTGRWRARTYNPHPGDLILFQMPGPNRVNHVGFCTGRRQSDGRVPTIEGNTSDSVQRRLRASYIAGFVDLTDYAIGSPPPPPPEDDDVTPEELIATLNSYAGHMVLQAAVQPAIDKSLLSLRNDEENTASRLRGVEARIDDQLAAMRRQLDRIDAQVGP